MRKTMLQIKPSLVETGRLVAEKVFIEKDSNIGILKHLGRG